MDFSVFQDWIGFLSDLDYSSFLGFGLVWIDSVYQSTSDAKVVLAGILHKSVYTPFYRYGIYRNLRKSPKAASGFYGV